VIYCRASAERYHCHLMDLVNKLSVIKILILKMLKMIVLEICLRS